MSDILETIVAHKREELKAWKAARPLAQLRAEMASTQLPATLSMRRSLSASPTGIIAEFKRRSPSKGWIRRDGDPVAVARAYEAGGASAMSVLTDTEFFGGTDADLAAVRASGVALPLLYKNFVIDHYQLLQARLCGASAVLLIAACLDKGQCADLLAAAHELGLEVLLEMHSEDELQYAELGPDMCGINNRHLGTFVTTVDNSLRLAAMLPKDNLWVSESGISSAQTVKTLRQAGYRGFLIGENFMRQGEPEQALRQFVGEIVGESPLPASHGGGGAQHGNSAAASASAAAGDCECQPATPTVGRGWKGAVKVCGMRDPANIQAVEEAGADMIGRIFYEPSPRNVPPCHGPVASPPAHGCQFVGVFVDPTVQLVISAVVHYGLHMVQLHGHESPTFIRNLRQTLNGIRPGIQIIKTISVERPDDIDQYRQYEGVADMLLFDTKCPTAGGSGHKFDWSAMERYQGSLPFLLSGGIGPDDAERIRTLSHPRMMGIDINSRFETAPAIKDAGLVGKFIAELRDKD